MYLRLLFGEVQITEFLFRERAADSAYDTFYKVLLTEVTVCIYFYIHFCGSDYCFLIVARRSLLSLSTVCQMVFK